MILLVAFEYSPKQVADRLERDDVQLIDVREPFEHAAGHIAGDQLLPLGELPARAQELDRERPIIFYCRTGNRSEVATEAFRGAGYDAYNMAGGLVEWDAEGLPLEPEGGHVAG